MAHFSESAGQFITFLHGNAISPQVVLDIGSRDAIQAVEFHDAFPKAAVFAFEALPSSVRICRDNTKAFPAVQVVEGAVHRVHGTEVPFYPVVAASGWAKHPGFNPGASSLFRAINDGYVERYEQTEIVVRSLRLDHWAEEQGIDRFDVAWMDLQGGELLALQGMGKLIHTVRAVKLEMTTRPMYHGQAMYDEVHDFLVTHGFQQVNYIERYRDWWGDGVYLQTNQTD